MEQLVEAYHSVAASPEFKEMMRQRERARHNEASALANAEQKGQKKGRVETLRENVRHMYQEGFSVEMIVKGLGLSEKEVKKNLGV